MLRLAESEKKPDSDMIEAWLADYEERVGAVQISSRRFVLLRDFIASCFFVHEVPLGDFVASLRAPRLQTSGGEPRSLSARRRAGPGGTGLAGADGSVSVTAVGHRVRRPCCIWTYAGYEIVAARGNQRHHGRRQAGGSGRLGPERVCRWLWPIFHDVKMLLTKIFPGKKSRGPLRFQTLRPVRI